jgi:hypothetical protein
MPAGVTYLKFGRFAVVGGVQRAKFLISQPLVFRNWMKSFNNIQFMWNIQFRCRLVVFLLFELYLPNDVAKMLYHFQLITLLPGFNVTYPE